MGIERTYSKMKQAQIVMLLVDADRDMERINESLASVNKTIDRDSQHLVVCINKIDLIEKPSGDCQELNWHASRGQIVVHFGQAEAKYRCAYRRIVKIGEHEQGKRAGCDCNQHSPF